MVAKKRKIKKSRKDNFFSALPIFLIFVFLGFLIISNVRIMQRRSDMLSEIQRLKQEIQELEDKTSNLESEISETDTEVYWEESAREQGFIKEGEIPVVVLPPEEMSEGQEGSGGSGFFERFLEKVKNILRE